MQAAGDGKSFCLCILPLGIFNVIVVCKTRDRAVHSAEFPILRYRIQ